MSAPQFGKKTKDRASDGGGMRRYIKGYQEARQEQTFLWDDPENEFIHAWTHYDHKNQVWYPCAKDAGADFCIGCSYPVENEGWTDAWLKDNWVTDDVDLNAARDKRKRQDPGWGVRARSGKYIFPAIDADGYTNIYAIGKRAWTQLCNVYDELGTITDQVFSVRCSAPKQLTNAITFMGTGKAPQTPKYEVPDEKAISEALGDKYLYAYDKYVEEGIIDGDGRPEPEPEADDPGMTDEAGSDVEPPEEAQAARPPAKKAPAKKVAPPKKAPAKATARAEKEEATAAASSTGLPPHLEELKDQFVEGWDPMIKARDARPSELKFWLDNYPNDGGIEYPPNAPRNVLVGLVEKAQVGEPPF